MFTLPSTAKAQARAQNKQRAFTLIELVVAIIIIGILTGIASVAYNYFVNRARQTAVVASAHQINKSALGRALTNDTTPDYEVAKVFTANGVAVTGSTSATGTTEQNQKIIKELGVTYGGSVTYNPATSPAYTSLLVTDVTKNHHACIILKPTSVVVEDSCDASAALALSGATSAADAFTLTGTVSAGYVAIDGSRTTGSGPLTYTMSKSVQPPVTFTNLYGAATTAGGVTYLAESNDIRKVLADGTTSTLAGSATAGNVNATGTAAKFNGPSFLTVDSAGTIYVSDTLNNSIRKVTPEGVVTTLASGIPTTGLAVDGSDNLYAATTLGELLKFSKSGTRTTLTQSGTAVKDWYGIAVSADGTQLYGVGIPAASTFEDYAYALYSMKLSGNSATVSLLAGGTPEKGIVDGTGTAAGFDQMIGLALGKDGNLYAGNGIAMRKITPAGVVTTLTGSTTDGGATDGTASKTRFGALAGVSVDPSGNLMVSDLGNSALRKVAMDGTTTTVAGGSATSGHQDTTAAVVTNTSVTVTGSTVQERYQLIAGTEYTFTVTNASGQVLASAGPFKK